MNDIRCIDNMRRLKKMLYAGGKGDAIYFSEKLGVSRRSFFRLLKSLEEVNGLKINYNKVKNTYYLESV